MPSQRIMVDFGGERKRCTLMTSPKDGWAKARFGGMDFDVVEVWGAWLTQPTWENVCRVLDASARKRKNGS